MGALVWQRGAVCCPQPSALVSPRCPQPDAERVGLASAQSAWPLPSLAAEWFIDFFGLLAPTYSEIMTLPPQL